MDSIVNEELIEYERQGHVDRIQWKNDGTPLLQFVGDKNGIPLVGMIDNTVKIDVLDQTKCTVCGKVSDAVPCPDCKGTAPTAKCVYKPGRFCTYNDCPFKDFKRRSCSQNFVVYLVVKSRIKAGITRRRRTLNRWYEQGAMNGMIIADAPNRKVAGLIERKISQEVNTRSKRGLYNPMNGASHKILRTVEKLLDSQDSSVKEYFRDDIKSLESIESLSYPTNDESDIIEKSDRQSISESAEMDIKGIQGQNMVSDEQVLNIRRISGRKVHISMVN
jgi:hypothetical protein